MVRLGGAAMPSDPQELAALGVVAAKTAETESAGKADGLAFSIAPEFAGRLGSLGNIFRELHDDIGVSHEHTDLSGWAKEKSGLIKAIVRIGDY